MPRKNEPAHFEKSDYFIQHTLKRFASGAIDHKTAVQAFRTQSEAWQKSRELRFFERMRKINELGRYPADSITEKAKKNEQQSNGD